MKKNNKNSNSDAAANKTLKKGKKSMKNRQRNFVQQKARRVGIKHQMNLIEVFELIYLSRHNIYTLLEEIPSLSKRSMLRYIEELNSFAPIIKTRINDVDGKAYFYVSDNMSEELFDRCFQKNNSMPVIYIYFLAALIRGISVYEMMEKTQKDSKEIKKIINAILDTSRFVDDFDDLNGVPSLGFWKFNPNY